MKAKNGLIIIAFTIFLAANLSSTAQVTLESGGKVAVGASTPSLNGSDYRLFSERTSTDAAAIMGFNGTSRGMLGVWDANFADLDIPLVQSIGALGYCPDSANYDRAAVYGYAENTAGAAYGGVFQAVGINGSPNIAVYANAANSTNSNYAGYFVGGKNYFQGKVGIGILDPSDKLEVDGTVSATAFAGDGSALTNVPGDNLGSHIASQPLNLNDNDIQNASVVSAAVFVGDGSLLTNISGDNLGDHIATQTFNLNNKSLINGGAINAASFAGDGSALTNVPGDNLGDHTSTQNIQLGNYFISGDGDSEGIIVTSTGNVGINITNPLTPLGILGNGGANYVGITQNQILGGATMELTTPDALGNQATRIGITGGTDDADIIFFSGPRGNEGSIMMIDGANGRLGIGTNTPDSRLDLGGGNISMNGGYISSDGDNEGVFVDTDGNVGVGTPDPSAKLHIKSEGDGESILLLETERAWAFQQEGTGSGSDLRLRNTSGANKHLKFDTNGSTRFRTQNGSGTAFYISHGDTTVGIGTITPTSRLDVAGGNISLNGGYVSNDGGDEGIRIGNNGRVGIGALPPSATKFYVSSDDSWGYTGLFESTGSAFALGVIGPTGNNTVFFVDNPDDDDLFTVLGDGRVGVGRTPTVNNLEVGGNASKSVAGFWLANSDRRIKTDIQTIDHAVDMLKRVRLVSFEYTSEYQASHQGISDGRYLNVIAQEFAEVFPDHVKGSGEYLPDGSEILQVDTYPLTIYSAAAIQELARQLGGQQRTIEQLIIENEELEMRVKRLEKVLERVVALEDVVADIQQSNLNNE